MREGDHFEVELDRDVPEGYTLAFHDGRTWFVRQGIAGERVRVRVTEVKDRIGRAQVVDVLKSSVHRTTPPCKYAGKCGGCDYQHIHLDEQRRIKSRVLSDALMRQGGMEFPPEVEVQGVPGDSSGLRWRGRMSWHFDDEGRKGLYAHRSHDLIVIDDCLIATPEAQQAPPGDFEQSHIGLPRLLKDRLIAVGQPRVGEHWWDLYSGSGGFGQELVSHLGPHGRVDCVEVSRISVDRARLNDDPRLRFHRARVEEWVSQHHEVDAVVLDPPRTGVPKEALMNILRNAPRLVMYISCNPVTFARDVRLAREHGYEMAVLEAFDAYPMTWHMELVAALVPRD
jgi:tRNA/tmRNA/rRNA uracil-C5-methylase (TrmA/RlmC/RlmD family)